jgi:polysaccharide chain length determinant protein (PEP-CTERM system associated)
MASQPIPMDPKYIMDLIVRRRWFLIVPFCLSITVGIYLAITLPKTFEAETLIMVEPQRVPSNYVRSIVSMDITSRISTISQQIMSRTNLEKVINDFNLFSDEKAQDMYLEDKLQSMRKRIKVNVMNRRSAADAFRIAFTGNSPEKVMRVTNALASYFINENLKVREAQAIGTSSFLEVELKNMRERLEEKENALRQYKKKYMGELPGQLETNLRLLGSLQTQKAEKETIIRGIEQNIYNLKNSANSSYGMAGGLAMDDFLLDTEDSGGGEGGYELAQLKEQLERLKLKYTEKHPDVLLVKRRIRELEERMAEESAAREAEPEEALPELPVLPAIDFQQVQLDNLQSSLKRQRKELDEINQQIGIYKKRVADTPQREEEMLSIRRDYNNINRLYQSLLNRKLESEIAVNMERRQKGEQFRILDSARLPEKPISPDMQKLFLLYLGAGLVVGGGIVFLLEYLDTSFKRPVDIEEDLGVSVLCAVPIILNARQKRHRKMEKAAFFACCTLSLMLLALFTLLTQKGVDSSLDLVKRIIA